MTVYVVIYESEFAGEYTRNIDGVFSTEEAALRYIDRMKNPNRYDVEEHVVEQ